MLDTVPYEAEGGIDHAPNRVMTHGCTEIEGAVLLMSVEPVPVVMIWIACSWMHYWVGGRVNRIIVERARHVSTIPLSENSMVTQNI
jgi:hypothetical protein